VTGAIAAGVVTATGLAGFTVLVLAGWIAAPHAGLGLAAVLRASAALWLVSQHVGFTFRGAGRIGLLPLGLVLLPGVLLWRAGNWVVRAGQVRRLRHVGYAAMALAVPYALAWFSHFFVEHNRPATFGHPLWSWAADQKMVAMVLAGKMGKEVERCAAERAQPAATR